MLPPLSQNHFADSVYPDACMLAAAALPEIQGGIAHAVRGPDNRLLPVCITRFKAADFELSTFAASGIDCPLTIARSVRKRQAEFYFGRLVARLALSALNITRLDVPIGRSREPVWPTGVIGSISHNDSFAAAIALESAHYSGVGIDIERIVRSDAQAALLATALCNDELEYLQTFTSKLPLSTLLTIVFSAKESLFKGAFGAVGRYFDFSSARVSSLALEMGSVSLTLTETLCDDFMQAQVCEVFFNFVQSDTVFSSYVW